MAVGLRRQVDHDEPRVRKLRPKDTPIDVLGENIQGIGAKVKVVVRWIPHGKIEASATGSPGLRGGAIISPAVTRENSGLSDPAELEQTATA
jgi:hypothetical protein